MKMPDMIAHNGEVYNKIYKHEDGGTYYSCPNSEYDWLDVYPNGEVKGLGNGKTYHIGKLDFNTQSVIQSSSTLANEYPWWNDLYDDMSIEDVSFQSGMTSEEIQDEIDSVANDNPGFTFETFASYNGTDDVGDYDTVAIYSDPSGAEFLAQISDGVLIDVTPDIAEILGYDDAEIIE